MTAAASLRDRGTTLVITLVTLAALSSMAAVALMRAAPRQRMAYQNAAWEEARLAAESGVDAAMGELIRNAANAGSPEWTGWKQPAGTPATATPGASVNQNLLTSLTAPVLNLLGTLLGLGGGPSPAASNSVDVSPPIYLDNFKVSAATGLPSEVDIQLWALQPTSSPHTQWFRIRSMATCALPPTAYEAPANLDAPLRRFSLRKVRPSLRRDDVGEPSSIRLPNVSRTVEVLVEPIRPFELALWTTDSLSLSHTGDWSIDSYDSTDTHKSGPNGTYPGRGNSLVQRNGNVASSRTLAAGTHYGPLIAANGTRVQGAVATNGGDDESTAAHENVSGAIALDQSRIRADFNREMNPVPRPQGVSPRSRPAKDIFVPGTESAPAFYLVSGTLTTFRIAHPGLGAKGVLVVMIDGDLDLAGPLIVPPNVVTVVYVRGNIVFRDNVNAGPWSSNLPSHLLIIGDKAAPRQSLQASGAFAVCAAFYGPSFDVSVDGEVDWCGAVAGYSFQVQGSGDGGIHYDESLAVLGPPISYRIARYIEDVRE